jgi:AraC family transcriptional regulator, exoenzyme S synthesis regulatory protein ExsA
MFTLPNELSGYEKQSPVFYYWHVNNAENNNSKLHFTRACISIGINGTKKLQTTSGIEMFDQRDLVFYTPGNYLSYVNIDTDQPYKSIMIFFDAGLFADLSKQFAESSKPVHTPDFSKPYLSLRGDTYVSNFLDSIMHLQAEGKMFTSGLRKLKLVELIVYLRGVFGNTFISEGAVLPGRLSQFQLQKVIENNLTGNLTLEELAFLCNMSLASFKRTFIKIYGTSPGKWIRERKLEWAAEQINVFHRSPKEIGFQAGYDDYSSFSYAFKQKFGKSPRKSFPKGDLSLSNR